MNYNRKSDNKGVLSKFFLLIVIAFTGLTIVLAMIYMSLVLISDSVKSQMNDTTDQLKARSVKVANFSNIPAGYAVTQAFEVIGLKAVIAENIYNKQTMVVADTGWITGLTSLEELDSKIKTTIPLINKQNKLKIDSFNVEKVDSFKALNQSIRYMKFTLSFSGEAKGDYRGIIALVKKQSATPNIIIISFNKPEKYKQFTAERFFQNIDF